MADVATELHAVELHLLDGLVGARCAARTVSPSAVTHSTRPPFVTIVSPAKFGAGVEDDALVAVGGQSR